MSWWSRWWRRGQMEAQLEKELRFHMEQHAADLIAQGRDPKEAMRLARLSLGGPEQVKEDCRDARGTRWLEDLWQDFRYALRTLRQKPGFAAVALLTLALGTGATTVMFTMINGVLLKPLPYSDPGRLVLVQEQTDYSTILGNLWGFTYPNFADCGRESRALAMTAWRFSNGTLSVPGPAENLNGRQISANLFSLLGIPLYRGRTFLPEEDRPGGSPVAIISDALWQRRFAGSADAIGSTLVYNGKSYTVVGVAPAGFRLDQGDADVFTPLAQDAAPYLENREAHRFLVWARLRPGATLAQAQAELALVGRRLAAQYAKSNKGRGFVAEPLRPDVGDVRSTLWLLLGAVSLVLLIACANIASLLLARAVSRERELAMRAALGAGRGRLVRQCLTESTVLGLCGGVLGIALAVIGTRPFVAFWPGSLPRAEEVHLDWHVLVFALAASLFCGFLFGLAPALRVPTQALERTLRAGARSVAGHSRRLHGSFVAAEIALAVVLLVCAGLLGRTLLRLSSLDPGLNVRNVLTARTALSPATLPYPAQIRAAWDDVLERARQVPGVEAAAMVDTVPMREGNNPIGYRTSPAEAPDNQQPVALATSVSPDYLKVMGIRLLEGRFFDGRDRMGHESVVVIDDVMAQQAYGRQGALGKHLWIDLGGDPVRVVGIVGHVRYWGPAGDDQAKVRAQLYYPFAQVPDRLLRRWSDLMSIAVRTRVAPLSVVEPLKQAVRGATGDQVIYEVRTLDQLAGDSLGRQRFLLLLFSLFAGLAMLLACIGIYGVLAYLTSRRVPEIGVRMALGATAGEVTWLVLRQSLGMILTGAVLGGAAALAAGRVLLRLVEGMRPAGLSTLAVTIPVLVLAALGASLIPALRASRLDPLIALRQE
ncbi:MAG: ABC transporter permease [Candidatus Sulfopaludibacter sp.]|nr:ABC transporter permease [Candidatus Sulfopaludibacter sp.]